MLYTPDELRRMPEHHMLMIRGRSAPILAVAKPYFEDKALSLRSQLVVPPLSHVSLDEPGAPGTPTGELFRPTKADVAAAAVVVDAKQEHEDHIAYPE